jgi:hypothetical protein
MEANCCLIDRAPPDAVRAGCMSLGDLRKGESAGVKPQTEVSQGRRVGRARRAAPIRVHHAIFFKEGE